MEKDFNNLIKEIRKCNICEDKFGFKPHPVVIGSATSKIVQISQAPSKTVDTTLKPFTDQSGKKLKYEWYQISDEEFYNPDNFFITALAHCYPGKDKNGCARIYFLGNDIKVGQKIEFNYTGTYQEYEIETTGYYKIECIGAKGGKSKNNGNVGADGGNGGYTSGIICLAKGEKIYVYVGGHGADAVVGKDSLGGYNGGGLGTWDHSDDESAGARRRSNRY